ncbi:phosphoribosylglycinamide formyltransferase [Neoconidiobolus thromboides FSU 785]|nr:phosphoribosylglycinamide formyltransferase [Neoconidiobolus thromboides FSU 785]
MPSLQVLVLISGSGSNLQALIDKIIINQELPSTSICGVISNRSNAYGLQRANSHNIPTSVLTLKSYKDQNLTRVDYDLALADLVLSYKPNIIVLAGFMHILSAEFLTKLPSSLPIINLHPALPGQFDGAKAIERAYKAFQNGEIEYTGVMVHRVIKEVDQGEPIVMEKVKILPEDTLSDLETRIHLVEHELLFKGLCKVVEELKQ